MPLVWIDEKDLCPECHGTGRVWVAMNIWEEEELLQCLLCGGSGLCSLAEIDYTGT